MLSPYITFGVKNTRKADKKADTTPEPTPDYIGIAEEAIDRIGKKLLVGAVVTIGAYVLFSVAGTISVVAFEKAIND